MKNLLLIFVAAFCFTGCRNVESQNNSNSNSNIKANSSQIEKIRISEDSSTELTTEQKKKLDGRIPPKIREILDKAKEIKISYNLDKNTMQLEVLMFKTTPNSEAKISDPAEKKRFLDSFYADASSNSNGNACFSPRHKLSAQYETKTIEIDICYECGNFRGESSEVSFGGGLDGQSKSSPIMDEIIKKYGRKIKK